MVRKYNYYTKKQYNKVDELVKDFYSPKEIKNILGLTRNAVRHIYRKLGHRYTNTNGKFTKGNEPFNKGMKGFRVSPATEFKKGITPHNTKTIGSIRINKDGLKEIKYCNHKWRSLHTQIWLKYYDLPEGSVVIFKNGADKINFTINDLRIVTRAELIKINRKKKTLPIQNN